MNIPLLPKLVYGQDGLTPIVEYGTPDGLKDIQDTVTNDIYDKPLGCIASKYDILPRYIPVTKTGNIHYYDDVLYDADNDSGTVRITPHEFPTGTVVLKVPASYDTSATTLIPIPDYGYTKKLLIFKLGCL